MSCMNFQIMIQAGSTDKRIKENWYEAFRYYLHSIVDKCFKDDNRDGGMI